LACDGFVADTVGTASPQLVGDLYRSVKDHVAESNSGVHLHSVRRMLSDKNSGGLRSGCGGSTASLTGLAVARLRETLSRNIATEDILGGVAKSRRRSGIDSARLTKALEMTNEIRRSMRCSACN